MRKFRLASAQGHVMQYDGTYDACLKRGEDWTVYPTQEAKAANRQDYARDCKWSDDIKLREAQCRMEEDYKDYETDFDDDW